MARTKTKFALRIAPETLQLVEEMAPRDNCQSKSEYIENAIRFYSGYVSGKEASDFLPEALVSVMRETLERSDSHTSRLLFKLAVEVDMMMNVLAAGMEVTPQELDDLRAQCVYDVKKTNGSVSYKDAVERIRYSR